MHWSRLLGLALLLVGIAFLIMGITATESPAEEIHETLTGRFTETTTWYLIGGVAGIVVGGVMFLFGVRK